MIIDNQWKSNNHIKSKYLGVCKTRVVFVIDAMSTETLHVRVCWFLSLMLIQCN